MAKEEPEVDPMTGNPGQAIQPEERHKHSWQGMRSGGKRIRMCSVCGKQEEKKDDE